MPFPFLAAAGIGAGVGALANILGESEEEKNNRMAKAKIAALLKQMEKERLLAQEEKTQSDRDFSGMVAERRGAVNQKYAQYGFSPSGTIASASNEKDLVRGNITNKSNIDLNFKKTKAAIQSEVDALNAGMQDEPSVFEKGLSGGIKGFNLGSDIYGAATGGIKDLLGADAVGGGVENTVDNSNDNFDLSSIMRKKLKLDKKNQLTLETPWS